MEQEINVSTRRRPERGDSAHGAARRTLRAARGWIEWDDLRDRPDWGRGTVTLDGRFTLDELRALILLAGHGC
ncbi:hypothetical protein [Burkholderia sp. 3C]